jgi:dihydroorotate dehydrogenase (fumarate)
MRNAGETPFRLDSPWPTIPLKEYAYNERRCRSVAAICPREAEQLLAAAEVGAREKYSQYEILAGRDGSRFHPNADEIGEGKGDEATHMDLGTRYLGLDLRSPLIASASPLAGQVGGIRELEDAGAGAVVLPSLFEEQIHGHDQLIETLTNVGVYSQPEASSYFPATIEYHRGPVDYLDLVARAREAVDIPVIASLNGTTEAGWPNCAALIEQPGAAALELNIQRIVADPAVSGAEAASVALLEAVRARVALPVAVKLNPYFSVFGALGRQLDVAGADDLVLFNRLYQPDIDLARLRWSSDVALSGSGEIRLGLLWLSLLSGELPRASLAASTGVAGAEEVLKYLLAGADAVMTTSALLRRGPGHLRTMLAELASWLEAREFGSVAAIKGVMRHSHPDAATEARGRADYISGLTAYRGPHVRW